MNKDDLVFLPALKPTHRLVLLHGWGANADDLIPIGKKLIGDIKNVDLVALRAPDLHPSGFGRQWYGLFPADWSSVPEAVSNLQARLNTLPNPLITLQKTVLLGFSQGGAMALSAGCHLPFAGLVGCSSYPHQGWAPGENIKRVLLLHGKYDEIVPVGASEALF